MGTLETEVAQHIADILNYTGLFTDDGAIEFRASANGDLIHATTNLNGRKDAWVLTVEWDGER